MNLKKHIAHLMGLFSLIVLPAWADVYTMGRFSDNAPADYSTNTFANIRSCSLRTITPEGCKDCSYVVVESNGRPIKSYKSATLIGRTDYTDVHYLVVEVKKSKDSTPQILVISDKGSEWDVSQFIPSGMLFGVASSVLSVGVDHSGMLWLIETGSMTILDLKTRSSKKIDTPAKFSTGYIGTDNKRRMAIVALDMEGRIWAGNGMKWSSTLNSVVGEFSDRKQVLSIYPYSDDEFVAVVYANINIYNKGVILVHGMLGSSAKYAWAINSDEKNFGFSPAVQWMNGVVTVAGLNSSEGNKTFSVSIPEQEVRSMALKIPPHAEGYQNEEAASAMVGVSVAKLFWNVNSKVEGLSKVDYQISNSLFKGVNLEGRYRSRNLALSYLQNETEDMALQSGGRSIKEASSMLFGYMDIDSFFDKSHSMRLAFEKTDLRGVATYRDSRNTNAVPVSTTFNNQYLRLSALDIGERGIFWRVDLTQSQLPVAVGFGNGGTASVAYFDKAAQFKEVSLGYGYDELAYAKRYESNYQKWYVSGYGGVGLGQLAVSGSITQLAAAALRKPADGNAMFIGFHGNMECGYLIQQRIKSMHGLGHSFTAGLRAQVDLVGRSAGSDEDTSDMPAQAAVARTDYLFGPFVRYNLVF